MTQETKKSNNLVFILIILALLGVIGYLLYSNNQKTNTIADQGEEIKLTTDSLKAKVEELEGLQLQYHSLQAQAAQLGQSNDSLNAKIAELDKAIASIKAGNKVNINKLNAQIDSYKKDLAAKEEEIIKLRAENANLTATNDTLKNDKRAMGDSIANLQSVRSDLQQKYELASILKVENIKVTVINAKDKELSDDEYKIKNVKKVKVHFTLGDNKVAPKNKKTFYIQVVEPSGSALFDSSLDGGFFRNSEGKEIPYTQKQNIDFNNTNQSVTFVYDKGSEYKVGTYTIKIYHDSNLVGAANFTVK